MNTDTVFITGASSGIGAAFARRLAAEGHPLLLHGRREELLRALRDDLRHRHAVPVDYVLGDLSDPAALLRLEERVRQTANLGMLINNAGFGSLRSFADEDIDAQEAMVRTHVTATMRLTHAVLPGMLRRGRGDIINVSSVAGFLISPGNASYCATKACITSFTESLHLEVRGSGVRVQALCPGFTRSDFHRRLGYDTTHPSFRRFMSAEAVVRSSLRSLERGTVVCIPGMRYRIAALGGRWIPRPLLYRLVLLARHRAQPERPGAPPGEKN
jgi:short-subunit dehydrogenase